MDRNNLNISNIEMFLYSIFKNAVSNNTYVGTFPDTIQSSWQDMCLIDCGSAIADLDALGGGVVLIWLYAKPLSDGSKNVGKMQELEEKLNLAISNSFDKNYRINRRNTYTDYDSDRKWHCNIVELNIVIF